MLDKNPDRGGRSQQERGASPESDLGSIGDRDVPLQSGSSTDVINRWLDGEGPEPSARGEAARSVEFWRRMGEETDRRRQMVTPAHVTERIMASLPPLATDSTMEPWYRRDVKLNAILAVVFAAGLFALGLIAARVIVP